MKYVELSAGPDSAELCIIPISATHEFVRPATRELRRSGGRAIERLGGPAIGHAASRTSRPSAKQALWRFAALSVLVALLLPSLRPTGAEAAVPQLINYQAYLTDDGGVPLDGAVDLEFAIYDAATDGTVLWTESHPGAIVQEGVASVALGSLTTLDSALFDTGSCWLETRIATVPVSPRRPFLAVPYALRAQVAETSLSGGGDGAWVVDGANVYRPDGNVGVGTTAPTERFHAVSPLFARLRLDRTGGTTVQTDASLTSGSVGTTSAHPFRLLTGNSVRMTVDTDGEIGIGTITPDGKLDVRASGGQDLLNLYDNSTNVVSVVSGGKVGIGTSLPQDRLQVVTGSEATAISGLASAATGSTFGGTFTSNSNLGTGAKGTGGLTGVAGEATGASGIGVFGLGKFKGMDGVSTATTGNTYGGYFQNSTAGGAGVYGSSGGGTGVAGFTNASTGFGVQGTNSSSSGSATGVKGEAGVYGVLGEGGAVGVNGIGINSGSIGVFGQSNSSTSGIGVVGQTGGVNGKGVYGNAFGDALYGVHGSVTSPSGWAGYFTGGRNYFEGAVGIGVTTPLGRFMVEADAGEEGARVRIGGVTKFKVDASGGVAVGANYTPPADGMAILGSVGIGTATPSFNLEVNGTAGKPGGGSWSTASDRRLKKNIEPLGPVLDRLCEVENVTFEYLDPAKIHELPGQRVGVIAQQVETLFPDWIDDGPDGYKRVTFRGFESLSIAALRELRAEKDAEIAQLRQEQTTEIAQLRQEQGTEIAQLREEHGAEISQLREEQDARIGELRAESETEIHELRSDWDAEALRLRAGWIAETQELIVSLQAKHDAEVRALTEGFRNEMGVLNARLDGIEGQPPTAVVTASGN